MSPRKTKNTPTLPVDDRGQLLDPFTGNQLIPLKELENAAQQIPESISIEEADRILQKCIARGDINITDAAPYIGIKPPTLAIRLHKIRPEGTYLLNGLPPAGKEGEVTVRGSDLVFRHPATSKGVYLRKELVDGMRVIEEEFRALEESGDYYLQAVTSNEKYDTKALSMRSKKIEPDGDYLENGEKPEEKSDEKIVKGSALRIVHPWNYRHVLLKKTMVDKWFQEEEPDRIVQERLARGDLRLAAAVEKSGLDLAVIQRRIARIEPDKLYRPDGSPPTGKSGEELVLGSDLFFRHPVREKGVYLRRELVDAIKQTKETSDQTVATRINQGDLSLREAAEVTGINHSSMHRFLSRIKPNKNYLADGSLPTGKDGEKPIKGSDLVYQSPITSQLYISSALVGAIKKKMEHGVKLADACKTVGISNSALRQRLAKIKPDDHYLPDGSLPTGQDGEQVMLGSDLVFRMTSNSDIYIHDALVGGMKRIEDEFKALESSGDYYLQQEICKEASIGTRIRARAERINEPDGHYTANGTKSQNAPGEASVKGRTLRCVHPWNSHCVLLRKTMVDGWVETVRMQKTFPATKIGDADESKLSEDVKKELEEKSSPKRKK